MKTILMMAAAFMLSTTASANVNPENGETPEKAVATTTQTMTIAELKAVYGVDNIEIEGNAEITDQTVVRFTKVAGPPCDGAQPCGAALAQARHVAQQQANACCCIQVSGVECCDKGTFKAILFLVEPNSPNCP